VRRDIRGRGEEGTGEGKVASQLSGYGRPCTEKTGIVPTRYGEGVGCITTTTADLSSA